MGRTPTLPRTRGRGNPPDFVNHRPLHVIREISVETAKKGPGRSRPVTVHVFNSFHHSSASFCIDHNIPKAICISNLGGDSDVADQY